MVDITQKPYFHHNDVIDPLLEPITSQADLQLIGYSRMFANRERFLICLHREWCVDFYTTGQLYRYGIYEKDFRDLTSTFDMWDHLPYAPPEVYLNSRKKFGFAHGLTIIRQHKDYSDSFVFAAQAGNSQINNFYLNQKELFTAFIRDFYAKMAPVLTDLASEKFSIPRGIAFVANPLLTLTPRQLDCAQLLKEGITSKEIAKVLQLSPRTVETHIDTLKNKFKARNRVQLMGSLEKLL